MYVRYAEIIVSLVWFGLVWFVPTCVTDGFFLIPSKYYSDSMTREASVGIEAVNISPAL